MLLAIEIVGGNLGIASGPPTFQDILDRIFGNFGIMFSVLLGIALVSMIIYSGSMYMFSGASPEKKAKAQAALTWTIVGGIVVLTIVLVINLLGFILGQGDLNTVTPGIFK